MKNYTNLFISTEYFNRDIKPQYYSIVFYDNNGRYILARTKSKTYVNKLLKRFISYVNKGKLLPIYKSAYK